MMEGASSGTTCPRCGDYAALQQSWSRAWCHACLARRDPIELEPPSVTSLLSGALRLSWQIGWGAPLLMFALAVPPLWAKSWLLPGTLVATAGELVYHSFVALFGIAAVVRLGFLRVVDPARASFGAACAHVLRRYPRVVLANSIALVRMLLYGLLLVVPGIVRALDYALVVPIAVNEELSVTHALDRSIARMRGRRIMYLASTTLARIAPLLLFFAIDPGHGLIARVGLKLDHPRWLETIEYGINSLLSIPVDLLPLVMQLKLSACAEQRRG
jgi:hypothetical protein